MAFKFKEKYGNFIGGKFVEPVDGQYFDNITPVNGSVLCQVARSNAKDIELAKGDCVAAVIEDLTIKKIIPTIKTKAGL